MQRVEWTSGYGRDGLGSGGLSCLYRYIGEEVSYQEQGMLADIYAPGLSHSGLHPGLVVYTGTAWHHSNTTKPCHGGTLYPQLATTLTACCQRMEVTLKLPAGLCGHPLCGVG